jgi:hypothetical protein
MEKRCTDEHIPEQELGLSDCLRLQWLIEQWPLLLFFSSPLP